MGFMKDYSAVAEIKDKKGKEYKESSREFDFPMRFFIPHSTDEEKEVVFLTDAPLPVIEEHRVWPKGERPRYFRCPKDENPDADCPLCESGDRPYTVGFYVVLDRTGYTDNDGDRHRDLVRILPAKMYRDESGPLTEFMKWSKKLKGLEGKSFDVSRGGKTTPAVGDSWMFVGTSYTADELCDILEIDSLDEVLVDWQKYLTIPNTEDLQELVSEQKNTYTDEDKVDFDD